MSHLKNENVTKCVSLLREFIEEASIQGNKKGVAILALNHLQRITAGAEPSPQLQGCVYELRIVG
jgi:hypothetical protein